MVDVSGRITHPVHRLCKTLEEALAIAIRMRQEGYRAVRVVERVGDRFVFHA